MWLLVIFIFLLRREASNDLPSSSSRGIPPKSDCFCRFIYLDTAVLTSDFLTLLTCLRNFSISTRWLQMWTRMAVEQLIWMSLSTWWRAKLEKDTPWRSLWMHFKSLTMITTWVPFTFVLLSQNHHALMLTLCSFISQLSLGKDICWWYQKHIWGTGWELRRNRNSGNDWRGRPRQSVFLLLISLTASFETSSSWTWYFQFLSFFPSFFLAVFLSSFFGYLWACKLSSYRPHNSDALLRFCRRWWDQHRWVHEDDEENAFRVLGTLRFYAH